jgi:phosphatidylserine/phosphatidylglycerophosphate/cardiolipin synthase-like enzyme
MDNGIPVIGDQLESMMHNKYLVIDEQIVWTGSANLTYSGIYHDHNHLIMLRNDRIVRNYKVDFDEMFAGNFGNAKRRNTPFPIVEMNAATVENYFSPEDKPLARLVELVSNAQAQIHFLAYSFTSDDLAEAMINRAGDGVDVRGVLETQQVSNQGGEYERFRQAGLDVRLDGLEGQMHHKVIIVDGKTVVTGSYNFTNSAERYNEENVLIIHSEMLAKQYEAEFEQLYARANP